jgi:DNA-binding GntR family transcriptional regulator
MPPTIPNPFAADMPVTSPAHRAHRLATALARSRAAGSSPGSGSGSGSGSGGDTATGDRPAALDAAPLDRAGNLHDAAYEQLRQALMDGHFVPGQTFTIRALARVFGTSPMPVRDALKRLVAERALDLRRNRSVVLPLMSRGRFQEILQVRLNLESMITLRAAARITPPVIEAMADDHRAMCEAVGSGDASQYLAANRRFHFRLYRCAESVVMFPVIESMWMQVGPLLNQVFQSPEHAVPRADHHHEAVLRALRRQDGAAAAKAIWDDLSDAADSILASNWFKD